MSRKIIGKYKLEVTDAQTIIMPRGARVLSAQTQFGGPKIWALIDADEPMCERRVFIIGTGHPITPEFKTMAAFVGTFQLQNGSFVGHVFVAPEDPCG
jgi:hypothetical protein